ncbi:MAG TPA: hypothetical protein DCE44_08490 [Verrucomicrobiales bacterium]|nr:hypothetical protein [Verrucomicrobiales bacterium]
MKITEISLQGFRAFDEPFDLDLDGGKNLLLHGENGSGKSSIYLALKRFFEERGDDITIHRTQEPLWWLRRTPYSGQPHCTLPRGCLA